MLTTAKVLALYGRLLYFSHLKNLLQIKIDFNEIFYVFSTLNRVFGTQWPFIFTHISPGQY